MISKFFCFIACRSTRLTEVPQQSARAKRLCSVVGALPEHAELPKMRLETISSAVVISLSPERTYEAP